MKVFSGIPGSRHAPLEESGSVRSSGRPWNNRRGLTLYEVVLSLVIFLGALATLAQVVATGSRAAVESRLRTQAILHCESKLAEILAGSELMQPVENMPLSADSQNWSWSLYVGQGPHPHLLELEVTVFHSGGNRAADVSYSLRRYVRDPQLFLDAAIMQESQF